MLGFYIYVMVRDKPKTDTDPTSWSESEEKRLLKMIKNDEYDKNDMYSSFDSRPESSVDNKIRRLRKSNGLYNSRYATEKYEKNSEWIEMIDDRNRGKLSVFDAYAGDGTSSTIYREYADQIVACEVEKNIYKNLESTISKHETVFDDCINELMRRNIDQDTFTYIDLDPFGTPFDAVPLAIKLIKNGYMAVTYGDIKLQRWGRTNVLTKQYKMPTTTEWEEVAEYMIGWTVFEGIRQRNSSNVRTIEPIDIQNFGGKTGILRVLYEVKKTGVLSDALKKFEQVSRDTGQPLCNRPYRVDWDELPS